MVTRRSDLFLNTRSIQMLAEAIRKNEVTTAILEGNLVRDRGKSFRIELK